MMHASQLMKLKKQTRHSFHNLKGFPFYKNWNTTITSKTLCTSKEKEAHKMDSLASTASLSFLPSANAKGGGTAFPICLCLC